MPRSHHGKNRTKGLLETLGAIAAIGGMVILVVVACQIAAAAIGVVVGIVVGLSSNWTNGIVSGVIAYAAVNRIIYYSDLVGMITSGKGGRRKAKEDASGRENAER